MDDTLQSLLRELERLGAENDARVTQRHDKMLNITPETGQLLGILIQGRKAPLVLEIGTSNGYSTLWLADAIQRVAGRVVTVDISRAKTEMARRNLHRAGLSRWVRLETAEAGQYLRQQPPAQVDVLFLDADRAQYTDWWPWLQRVLAPGGLLVVDNAVSHAVELERFIAQVRATPDWPSVLVPIGNGQLLALKPAEGGVRQTLADEAGTAAPRDRPG